MNNSNHKIVCPFCSLLCDDIEVSVKNNKFNVINQIPVSCKKKIEYFNINSRSKLLPTINDKISSLTNIIKKTRSILENSNDTTIINHGIDMNGVRSMLRLASNYNCTVDHVSSKYLYNNIGVVQRTGYMATSLTEAKNRADVFIFFGNDIFNKSPRLIERICLKKGGLKFFKGNKKIILIGNFKESIVTKLKKNFFVEFIKTPLDNIPKILEAFSSNELIKENSLLVRVNKIINFI